MAVDADKATIEGQSVDAIARDLAANHVESGVRWEALLMGERLARWPTVESEYQAFLEHMQRKGAGRGLL